MNQRHSSVSLSPVHILSRIEKMTIPFSIPLEDSQKKIKMNPFQILISIVLSARTKDSTTARVSEKLSKKVKIPADLYRLSFTELESIIHPIGFFHTKAGHLKKISALLLHKPLPKNHEGLLALPGIGRKTAALFLSKVMKIPAVCVDTHVHRISNLIFFNKNISKNTNETEKKLMALFPQKYWSRINSAMVKFGQNICRPRYPRCEKCLLKRYCPYYLTLKK